MFEYSCELYVVELLTFDGSFSKQFINLKKKFDNSKKFKLIKLPNIFPIFSIALHNVNGFFIQCF